MTGGGPWVLPGAAPYTGTKGASLKREPYFSDASSCCSDCCLPETCNLQDLAARPGMPTKDRLRRMIREHRDFPVISVGRNGSAYVLPTVAAEAFVRQILEPQASPEARAACVREMGLVLIGGGDGSL